MTNRLPIPFVKNRSGAECGQACAAMMIKYYYPDFGIDFEKLNKAIHYEQGMYTFPLQLAILLDNSSIKTQCFSSDDIKTISEDPNQFKRWFKKDYDYEMEHIDLKSYDWMVREGRKRKLFTKKKTSLEEIIALFTKGYLVSFVIDWNTLTGKRGPFEGHFVLLSGVTGNELLIHDPDNGPFVSYSRRKLDKAYNRSAISDDLVAAYGKKETTS